MPALKDTKGQIATFMKEKEKLVYKIAFLSPPKNNHNKPVITPRITYQTVSKEIIYKILIIKSTL